MTIGPFSTLAAASVAFVVVAAAVAVASPGGGVVLVVVVVVMVVFNLVWATPIPNRCSRFRVDVIMAWLASVWCQCLHGFFNLYTAPTQLS